MLFSSTPDDYSEGTVTSINPDSGQDLKTFNTGNLPLFMAGDPASGMVYVTDYFNGTIHILNDR